MSMLATFSVAPSGREEPRRPRAVRGGRRGRVRPGGAPAGGGRGGLVVDGVGRWWSVCRGGVLADGGASGGLVGDGLAGGAGGQQCGDREPVDGPGQAAGLAVDGA